MAEQPPQPPPPAPPTQGGASFVLDWRPSVPGPKMSAFLVVSSALTGLYIYDRTETKRIQQEYIDQVKWMSQQTLQAGENARKVRVLAARVPDDGELERSSMWFKRYMRPILVASGTDYILKVGTNPGGLGRTLAHEIRARRITQAAQDQPSFFLGNSPQANVNAVLAERDLDEQKREEDGAIILLGRGALKEYLWALRKGWGEPIDLRREAKLEGLGLGATERRKDGRWEREEELMREELEREDEANPNGGPFDEKDPDSLESAASTLTDAADTAPSPPVNFLGPAYSSFRPVQPAAAPTPAPSAPSEPEAPLVLPPSDVPAQPPLLLVPFSHPFGIRTWPGKLAHFWNHRSDARLGGEYALALVAGTTRAIEEPKHRSAETGALEGLLDEQLVAEVRRGEHHELAMSPGVATGSKDLDFGAETDEDPAVFKKQYRVFPKGQEFHRRTYYADDLPGKLKTARELARSEREATKAEINYPPKIESELRKERLDKELRWRREQEGWAVQRAGSGVAWQEGWEDGRLRVLELPGEKEREELRRGREAWEAQLRERDERREEMWKREDALRSTLDDDE
ncbi:hypothetical protein JCM10207_007459 [Rhodosporidiobolus poonsookiae]